MFFRKYKILKNNGLLPKIDHPKPESILTTYCLFNEHKQRQYSLMRNPSNANMLVMFNEKEYLHKKCTLLTNQQNHEEILKQISSYFPSHSHTFTIFIANQPDQCDKLILGQHSKTQRNKKNAADSLLVRAYKNILMNKSQESTVKLSIMGIESQNTLTDELNLQWLDQHQERGSETPLEVIIKCKQEIRVIKDHENNTFRTQNLTRHEIVSEYKLLEILERYKDVKSHLQNWMISTEYTQYFLLGELYHISEIEPQSPDHPQTTLQSHYILRVNQYIRVTSPLMMRLGVNLRRAEEDHFKSIDMHESKLFKLLSECFLSRSNKNGKYFQFHLFLQVGEYATLKDEYLCLVPTSQQLNQNQSSAFNSIQSDFFYTKQIMEYPELHAIIDKFIDSQNIKKGNEKLLPQISGLLQARLKTKSYVCDTYSSQEKRIKKFRHLITEPYEDRSQLNLEDLVYEAAKIYRLPSPKKNSSMLLKENFTQLKKKPQKNVIILEDSSECIDKADETNFERRRKKDFNTDNSKKQLSKSKFYEETKEWLGFIYGKNSSKKLKSASKRGQKFDETTNVLIRDMLNKEINCTANEEIDEMIDRF